MKHFSVFYILLAFGYFALAGCEQAEKTIAGPPGYQWNKPEKFFLRETLQEISGIGFKPNADSLMYAVNDEEGKIFAIRLKATKEKMPHVKFGRQNDYEDLTWWQNQWWVLQSNGSIFRTALSEDSTKAFENLLPRGEYETMASNGPFLYVVCKHCQQEDLVIVYRLSADSSGVLATDKQFSIDHSDVTGFLGKKKMKFRPSAMAWHPVLNQWYIMSANDRMLVTTDEAFKVTGAWPMPASLFPQPEGIAISPSGDVYISNEGSESTATLLKFTYQPMPK